MALTAYLNATNHLLQNPVPANPLYATADLTSYINEGRQQLAGEAQCIRAFSSAALTANQQIYPFTLFTNFYYPGNATGSVLFSVNPSPGDTITLNGVTWTFVASGAGAQQVNIGGVTALTIVALLAAVRASTNPLVTAASYGGVGGPNVVTFTVVYNTPGTSGNTYTLAASAATPSGPTLTGGTIAIPGIQSVLTVRQLQVGDGVTWRPVTSRPWPWFNRYFIGNGVTPVSGTVNTWSQQGLGTFGTFGVGPAPAGATTAQVDAVCLPVPLLDDTTYEALPYPFTDAIPYYAAYKAYLSSQRRDDATTMFGRYQQFARRAIQETAPVVFPDNFQGGRGAAMVSLKQSLTTPPQAPQQGG